MLYIDCNFALPTGDIMTFQQYAQNVRPTI